ncbi:hypothetical protein [Sedimentibacter sp.]|uniref:hypothetical protein n=1 Tax=Sedimentibacter sp. TaxID=1960295 RepID=UPI0028AE2814|nr:hypothetical protein [Sedimentibacter sp.]
MAGDIWINRQDILQGHYILNNAVMPLISAMFISNEEYIPHDKWLIHMSRTLEWKPDNWDDVLINILSTGNFDLDSLISRQKAIEELWVYIDKRLTTKTDLKVSFMQKYYFETFKILIEKGKITTEEWEKISSINILNNQPFSDVTYISNGIIYVDINKLLSLKPDNMYQWFYEVADIVRTQLNIKAIK